MNQPTSAPEGAERFTFGLINDVFTALEQHGYVKGDDRAVGSAVGVLLRLVSAYEGGQS